MRPRNPVRARRSASGNHIDPPGPCRSAPPTKLPGRPAVAQRCRATNVLRGSCRLRRQSCRATKLARAGRECAGLYVSTRTEGGPVVPRRSSAVPDGSAPPMACSTSCPLFCRCPIKLAQAPGREPSPDCACAGLQACGPGIFRRARLASGTVPMGGGARNGGGRCGSRIS